MKKRMKKGREQQESKENKTNQGGKGGSEAGFEVSGVSNRRKKGRKKTGLRPKKTENSPRNAEELNKREEREITRKQGQFTVAMPIE